MAPIAIKYYHCLNDGVSTLIYPQLRNANDPRLIVWDGRAISGFTYCIPAGQEVTLDLGKVGVPTKTVLILGCNVVFGTDEWDANDTFVYDPTSDLMVTAQKYGPTEGGGLVYLGIKAYSEERGAKISQQKTKLFPNIVTHFQNPLQDGEPHTYKGTVVWPTTMTKIEVEHASANIVAFLINRRYVVRQNALGPGTTNTISFGPFQFEPALTQVQKDWQGAVHTGHRYHPEDKGAVQVSFI